MPSKHLSDQKRSVYNLPYPSDLKEELKTPPRMFSQEESYQSLTRKHPQDPNILTEDFRVQKEESKREDIWGKVSSSPEILEEQPELIGEEPETVIGQGIEIKGELSFSRLICIHGTFEGTLTSKGKIIVGPTGVVRSEICLKEAIVEGFVEGNIIADRIELRGDAQVHGDLTAKTLSVDEGVTLVGQVMVRLNDKKDQDES